MHFKSLKNLGKSSLTLPCLLALVVPSVALAGEKEDALNCALLTNQQERHNCIDAVAQRLQNTNESDPITAQTDEPEAIASDNSAVAELGTEQLRSASENRKQAQVQAVHLDLEKITYGQRRLASFHLTNGQIWRQTELVRFSGGKSVRQVEIKKGTLGGYRLRLDGQRQFMRVRRVK